MPSSSDVAKVSGMVLIGAIGVISVVASAIYGIISAFGWTGLLIFILFWALCWLIILVILRSD